MQSVPRILVSRSELRKRNRLSLFSALLSVAAWPYPLRPGGSTVLLNRTVDTTALPVVASSQRRTWVRKGRRLIAKVFIAIRTTRLPASLRLFHISLQYVRCMS